MKVTVEQKTAFLIIAFKGKKSINARLVSCMEKQHML